MLGRRAGRSRPSHQRGWTSTGRPRRPDNGDVPRRPGAALRSGDLRTTSSGVPMGRVNTVRGPIDDAALGTTLMHEHVFILSPDVQQNYPLGWDDDRRIEDAVGRL